MCTELLASRLGSLPFAALREGGRLAELFIDAAPEGQRLGQIVRARVTRVASELQAAFLDVGGERGGLLHAEDLVLPGEDSAARSRPLATRLSAGRDLLVQIAREPLVGKGPKLTGRISLTGRYLVMMSQDPGHRISRRITDPALRERLSGMLSRFPGDVGWLARTAAARADVEALRSEAARLMVTWQRLTRSTADGPVPQTFGKVPGPLARALRDLDLERLSRVRVDRAVDRDEALRRLHETGPPLSPRVELHVSALPLVTTAGLEREIERLLQPSVSLPGGGRITIQETEALISVDVDSGKFRGSGGREESALAVDLEAAAEVARQLRARDLGGIVAIDFIDLERADNRERLVIALGEALAGDRTRTRISGIHEPGLVLLTRERRRCAPLTALSRPCPDCTGGRIKAPPLLAAELLGTLARREAKGHHGAPWSVEAHPDLLRELEHVEERPRSGWRLEPRPEWSPVRFEIHPAG